MRTPPVLWGESHMPTHAPFTRARIPSPKQTLSILLPALLPTRCVTLYKPLDHSVL